MTVKQIVIYALLGAVLTVLPGCSGESKKEEQSMSAKEIELTDANFDAETGKGVVLVDFWAEWCGPCLTQGPIIEKVADAMSGKAKITKFNVDGAGEVAERFGIRSIPTLIILKDGKEVERFVGVQQEAELVASLEKYIEREK